MREIPVPEKKGPSQAKLNSFDKAISKFLPGVAEKNLQARQRLNNFEYNSANAGKLRGYHGGLQKNASAETAKTNRDRINLMWEARDMERNNVIIAGILERMVQYIVGKLEYRSTTGDPEIDKIYQNYFHDWCKRCDITGRFSFREMVEIALRSTLRDGDYGLAFINTGLDILLQGVESDRIGKPTEFKQEENYISGIKLDENGRPSSYCIFKRNNKTLQYTKDKELPPEHFMHLWRPIRNDQYRGISFLAPALAHARDLHEIFGFEKQGAKFSSMWAAFIKTKQPYDVSAGEGWDTSSYGGGVRNSNGRDGALDNRGTIVAEPGKVTKIDSNTEIDFAPGVQRPSGAFMNLVRATLQNIALGLNLPYGFVYDMSELGGASVRLESQQAQRTFQRWQNLITDKVLDRVRDQVLSSAIIHGRIPSHPNFKKGNWRFGAHITADIQHQMNADIQALNSGLESRSRLCEIYDRDIEQVAMENAATINGWKRVSEETNVPMEMLVKDLPQATEMLANMATRNDPKPEPSLIEKGFDLKILVEILKEVGDGTIDREAAVSNLIAIYGLDPQMADALVPKNVKPKAIHRDTPITPFKGGKVR